MSEGIRCAAGDWVEVRYVLLEPADRSANLPPDTAAQPLLVWAKGFAREVASAGDEVTVETMTGRAVTGALADVNPGYTHTFGRPAPELTRVGRDLRARLAAFRAGDGAGAHGASRPEDAAPTAGE
ncbi:MAG TPA: 2-amino-4-oxopentanoate thiolase subunit OrtA [Coriobacteriia bacterium]